MSDATAKTGYIRQAWLVIFLALAYGGALAGVQTTLGPRIEENKRQETYSVIPALVEGADKSQTVEKTITGKDGKPQTVFLARDSQGTPRGWVVPATGQGFADRIDVLIGLDLDVSTITGLYVLDQKETPGLGNLIQDPAFQDRFIGKRTSEPVQVVKDDPAAGSNAVKALTGATISSESVATIVNSALKNLKEPIREL